MISVLIRSVGRKSLKAALDSVAIQNVQCLAVLVDAAGDLFDVIPKKLSSANDRLAKRLEELEISLGGHIRAGYANCKKFPAEASSHPDWPDFSQYPFQILIVSAGKKLGRAHAAGLALRLAQILSELAIFLDDDDVFLLGHLEKLQAALRSDQEAVLAHTSAYLSPVTHHDLSRSRESLDQGPLKNEFPIGRSFEAWELLYSNHIPIHCALFRTSAASSGGVAFDSQFDVFEDWDFWLQMRCLGRFHWVDGCTARYFAGESTESASMVHELGRRDDAYTRLWSKWRYAAPASWWMDLLARTGPLLNRFEELQQTVVHLTMVRDDAVQVTNGLTQSLAIQKQSIYDLQKALSTQFSENQRLHEELATTRREHLDRERFLIDDQSKAKALAEFWHQRGEQLEKRSSELSAQLQAESLAKEKLHQELNISLELAKTLREEQAKAIAAAEHWRRRSEVLASHSAQLQSQLGATLQSRSWRFTKPLRTLGKFARRVGLGKLLRKIGLIKPNLHRPVSLIDPPVAESVVIDSVAAEQVHTVTPQPAVLQTPGSCDQYQDWIRLHEPMLFEATNSLRSLLDEGRDTEKEQAPLISVVMPIYNPPLGFFKEAIASLQQQKSPRWELCIADDASTETEALKWLREVMKVDPRIKLIVRTTNGHISACSNSALSLATADWVALMDQDDRLSPFAIDEVIRAIKRFPNAKLFYSDEDKIDATGFRSNPYFKPAFNLELLRAQNTFSHFGVYERALVDSVGGFRVGLEGSQDHDLVLRCSECVDPEQIIHIPKVLYHWRIHEQSTAAAVEAKPYAVTNGLKAVNDHLSRTTAGAFAIQHESISHYIVQYPLPLHLPSIDVIIPTRNGFDVLSRCLETLFKTTQYPDLRITVVDNGSDDMRVLDLLETYRANEQIDVIRYESVFNFSAINNFAVGKTNAEYLLFLNNDIEIIQMDWLDVLLRQACRPEVGAVGAMLWYPNMTMQHAGVVIGAGGIAGHAHHGLPMGHPGYFGRATLPHEVSAVTAACLLMRRSVFSEAGGFDEKDLAVAFNDVDLCLKVRSLGYKVIFTPRASLIHHESATRGDDLAPEHRERFKRECEVMRKRWTAVINNDPSYNPNLEIISGTFGAYAASRAREARTGSLPGCAWKVGID